MTLDDATSTSDCIGEPRTPLCAVETMEACTGRNIKALCDIVETDLPFLGRLTPVTPDSYVGISVFKYEILKLETLADSDVRSLTDRLGEGPWRAGDVAVTLWWTVCRPQDACIVESRDDPRRAYGEGCPAVRCLREPLARTSVVRRKGDRWVIVRDYLEPVPYGDAR